MSRHRKRTWNWKVLKFESSFVCECVGWLCLKRIASITNGMEQWRNRANIKYGGICMTGTRDAKKISSISIYIGLACSHARISNEFHFVIPCQAMWKCAFILCCGGYILSRGCLSLFLSLSFFLWKTSASTLIRILFVFFVSFIFFYFIYPFPFCTLRLSVFIVMVGYFIWCWCLMVFANAADQPHEWARCFTALRFYVIVFFISL